MLQTGNWCPISVGAELYTALVPLCRDCKTNMLQPNVQPQLLGPKIPP